MSRITNDVGQVQRAVSETIGDLTRESLALLGFAALLFYYDARLAMVCLTGAPLVVYPLVRLGQRVRRTTRRSQEALEQMSHLSAEAFTGHRIVKAFGAEARETAKFEQSSHHFYRTNMKVTGVAVGAAAADGVHRRRGIRGGAVVRQPGDHLRPADDGGVHGVHCGAVHDVRAGEEAEPGQLRPSAGDGRGGAHLRDARHAQRGEGARRRRGAAGVCRRHRVPGRAFRVRRSRSRHPPRRQLRGRRRPDARDRRPQRRRQDHARQPDSAVLRRDRRRHPDRRPRRAGRDAGVAARADRHRDAGNGAVRRHASAPTSRTAVPGRAARRSRPRRGRRTRTSSSRGSTAGTTR